MARDIKFDIDGFRFNYRVAAIILRDECVLVEQVAGESYWFLPGGRVKLGERTESALVREIDEELAIPAVVQRLTFVVESFFTSGDTRFHEVCFYFETQLETSGQGSALQLAPPGKSTYKWARLDEVGTLDIQPTFLRRRLQSLPAAAEHLVLNE